jgi:hypothetical protein
LALGCGAGPDSAPFTVEPEVPAVAVGDQLVLLARPNVDLSGDLEWEVQELYGGGLLNSQGPTITYLAPEAAGTYHLLLRAPRRDGRNLKQTIEVRVLATPSLEPGNPRVAPGGAVQFTAHMKGLPRNTARWSVEEGNGGEIGEDGRYLAPARTGTYHVLAVSTLDPTVSARGTVVVE